MNCTKRCSFLKNLPALPDAATREKLQRNGWKKRRKSKHPKIRFLCGNHATLGAFHIEQSDDGFVVKYRLGSKGDTITARLTDLCDSEEFAEQRLQFGWLLADLFEHYGNHMLHEIPGPNEAMRESSPFLGAASDWRKWAIG